MSMPPSPSETRTKWKKRKRESQSNNRRQQKPEDEDDEEDHLEREDYDSEDQNGSKPQAQFEIEVFSDGGTQICQFPMVIKRTVNRPHSSITAIMALERANESGDNKGQFQNPPFLENLSHGQLQTLSAVPVDSDGSNSAYVITPPPVFQGCGIIKRFGTRVLVVPVHSDWFSPTKVHRLERQVVPHFFSGKSPYHTPEKYMECRNSIVAKYMEDLRKSITVPDCQGLSVSVKNEDLTRIIHFLDHWGIINYCAQVPSNEPYDKPNLKEEKSGEICVPSDALKSVDSLIKFDKSYSTLKADEICSFFANHYAEVTDLDDRIRERLSENHCNSCSCSLSVVFYQSQKEADILLCTDCFHDGRFIIGHSSIDFMRLDSTKDYGNLDGDSWTDQETLLLLEAMEIYNDNWNDIAEHVGTKSKAQCILHFLRLPMEDVKLGNINIPSISLSSNMSSRDNYGRLDSNSNGNSAGPICQSTSSDGSLPFANSGNPVMCLVSFLASAVGPRVAAACSHAALAVLSEDKTNSMSCGEVSEHGNRISPESLSSREAGPHGETANSNHQSEDKEKLFGNAVPLPPKKVKDAAKAGLSAAAMKAKLFADHEERETQRLCAIIINHQLKRLELKLKQFAEIETLLMKECEQVEKTRHRFAAERSHIVSARLGSGGATPPVNVSGVDPSIINNNNSSNNRQQIMSTSPAQPSISGYGNSQPVHPQMPFVPRPSMFGLGQRLPLSMIQQPQSASSNAMFSAPGNLHPTIRD